MTKSLYSLALFLALACPDRLFAQDTQNALLPRAPEKRITASGGFDFVYPYFFRGIIQENQNIIFQPWYSIGATELYQGGDWFQNLDMSIISWNSLHSGPTGTSGANQSPSAWYEADFTILFSIDFQDRWNLEASYTWYTSPNGSFATIPELLFEWTFDDSAEWNDTIDLPGFAGFQPSLALGFELDGQRDGVAPSGTFLGLGIEPGITLEERSDTPIGLSFPLRFGFSLDDYYQEPVTGSDDFYGFFQAGVDFSMPLNIVSENYGSWELRAGLHIITLGSNMKALNTGNGSEIIGSIGVGFTF